MNAYIVVTVDTEYLDFNINSNVDTAIFLVVRTSDGLTQARTTSAARANLIASALNASV